MKKIIFKKDIQKKSSNILCSVLYVLSASILILTIFLYNNNSTTSFKNVLVSNTEYETQITKHIESINSINCQTSVFINNSSIYTTNIKSKLPGIISKLTQEEKSIENLKADTKYTTVQSYLLNGLCSNINIYSQILGIINNPNGNDMSVSLKNLNNYRNECENYYKKVKIKSTCPSLTKEAVAFIKNTVSYTGELINTHEVSNTFDSDYENKIKDLDSNIHGLLEYHDTYIKKARLKTMSYDDVLAMINAEQETLKSINNEFINSSVPEYYESSSILFKKTIDDLSAYFAEITRAVKSEKSMAASGKINITKADALYDKSHELYNTAYNDYTSYSKETK